MHWRIELKEKYQDDRDIVLAWHNGEINEGQASTLLNLNRLEARKLKDKYICLEHNEIKEETIQSDGVGRYVCSNCVKRQILEGKYICLEHNEMKEEIIQSDGSVEYVCFNCLGKQILEDL